MLEEPQEQPKEKFVGVGILLLLLLVQAGGE